MNAKKSHRIRVLDRSKSAEGIAQRREYKRNCRKISNAIDEMVEKYWGDDHRHFSGAIMALVRDLIGCRISEISDSDMDAALAWRHKRNSSRRTSLTVSGTHSHRSRPAPNPPNPPSAVSLTICTNRR